MNIMATSASGAFHYVMQHFPEPGIIVYSLYHMGDEQNYE